MNRMTTDFTSNEVEFHRRQHAEAIAAWLQHIDRLDEIAGARDGLPKHNPLWDAGEAIRIRFGFGSDREST
jgi:hypothetical protein